ncbi:hypothetical protein [Virgibacillus sp. Bac332]|uniref:hypothetical protein n=1 Tax=Virgibacillus sp. Bac332 TaxID=2419842 RepID=UPI0013CEA3EA|nr:hypothetical protein [Virgibacillus sp. Bac332]
MRAIIKFKGKQYPVLNIWWNEDGSIANLSFDDENGDLQTIFNHNYDLENMVSWEEC